MSVIETEVPSTRNSSEQKSVLVARQPICGLNRKTLGYELLFRDTSANRAVFDNPEAATAEVITNSFVEIGLDRIVGRSLAFVNVTREFIMSGQCRLLPKKRVVFEILEGILPDRELMDELIMLRRSGYRFALDDYSFEEYRRPFLSVCEYIKVDLRQTDRSDIIQQLKQRTSNWWLAEKVETQEEYEFCRTAGFHFFQGYYFAKPRIISGSRLPANRLSMFRVLARLTDPEVDLAQLGVVVSEDLSMSYKLLRFINSAYIATRHDIKSVDHAVRLVGTEQIRLLASLIMMTGLDDTPRELISLSLIRAKMCESLAVCMRLPNKATFFTVGLFSTLDAFLNCPLDEALARLPLSNEISSALLQRAGILGKTLDCVLRYEQTSDPMPCLSLDANAIPTAYLDAVRWTEDLIRTMAPAR